MTGRTGSCSLVEAVTHLKVRSCLIDGEVVRCDGGLSFAPPEEQAEGVALHVAARGSTRRLSPYRAERCRRSGPGNGTLTTRGLALRSQQPTSVHQRRLGYGADSLRRAFAALGLSALARSSSSKLFIAAAMDAPTAPRVLRKHHSSSLRMHRRPRSRPRSPRKSDASGADAT